MSDKLVGIAYLESSDFNGKSLKPTGKPTVVMVQGTFCGYCTKAKPAFTEFASKTSAFPSTIQIDGGQSEKDAYKIVQQLDPSIRGVPVYLGFDRNGQYVKTHSGGRDAAALMAFSQQL